MVPKIHENGSKNRLGADIGLQILVLGGFWGEAKISRIFDAFLKVPKIEKIGPRSVLGGSNCERGTTFWRSGPQGRRLFARESTLYQGTKVTKYKVQRYKATRQVRKGNKAILRDLTRPKAKGLANF